MTADGILATHADDYVVGEQLHDVPPHDAGAVEEVTGLKVPQS